MKLRIGINIFAIVLSWIWQWRNIFVFHEKKTDLVLKVKCIKTQYIEIISAFASKKIVPSQNQDYSNCIMK